MHGSGIGRVREWVRENVIVRKLTWWCFMVAGMGFEVDFFQEKVETFHCVVANICLWEKMLMPNENKQGDLCG